MLYHAAEEQTATTSEISSNMLRITEIGNLLSQNAHGSSRQAGSLVCVFGKWYQAEGKEQCGQIGAFRELDAPHARVHEFGRQALQAHMSGNGTQAESYCREMGWINRKGLSICWSRWRISAEGVRRVL